MKNELARRPSTLFESLLGDDFLNNVSYGTGIDIYKEENQYVVDVEMPGFNKEDIEIQYTGDVLTIKADHKESDKKDEKDYYYRSRKQHTVNRQIRFADVDETKVDASYDNGVLKVILPKKTQEEIVNRINVK